MSCVVRRASCVVRCRVLPFCGMRRVVFCRFVACVVSRFAVLWHASCRVLPFCGMRRVVFCRFVACVVSCFAVLWHASCRVVSCMSCNAVQ